MLETRFIAFLGEGEPEVLLPDDEAERERLLQDANTLTMLRVSISNENAKSREELTNLRTGERLCLCLEAAGPRLGGLLLRGDILLLGLCLLRGE